jgi:hypothetical protein
MQLVNTTPLPARVDASEVEGMEQRIGMLTAKATFRFDLDGRVQLETQRPFPLFADDVKTPLGLLPSDAEPRRDDAFEVVLLGHAYAKGGIPVEHVTAALTVGAVRREIIVTGDRVWTQTEQGPVISRPAPFEKRALTWAYAFGGSQPVQLDASSVIDVSHPANPHGRGFDAQRWVAGLAGGLRAQQGYPALPEGYRRALPNLEDPSARIARWDDEPEPVCWGTAPRDVLVGALRHAREHSHGADSASDVPETWPDAIPPVDPLFYRAHPDWVVPVPREAPLVRLENLTAERPVVEFRLPSVRLVGDYVVEGRRGARPLNPLLLVVLPDDRSLYLLYSTAFTFPFHPGDDRAFRLRIADGWYPERS